MFILFPKLKMRISVFAIPAMLILLLNEGAIPFAILLFSAAFHEMGHLLAIWFLGYKIRRIDLLPMGALIVVPEGIPHQKEWKIALAGPLFSLLLALVSAILFAFIPILPLFYGLVINLVLALFNLLPIKLLDGGKALFCFLVSKKSGKHIGDLTAVENAEKKAERFCSALSYICLSVFVLSAMLCLSAVGFNFGVVLLVSFLLMQLTGKL